MFDFIKNLFSGNRERKKSLNQDPVLNFKKPPIPEEKLRFIVKEDVHKLMIKATGIRKREGYPAAILFLQKLAETYSNEKNTALVACMNKLIPYMKKDLDQKPEQIKNYLQKIIDEAPKSDPYFLNLYITMARLIKSYQLDQAIEYLETFLSDHGNNLQTYNHQIEFANYLSENGEFERAGMVLAKAHNLLNNSLERFDHIKKERKWHRSAARLQFQMPSAEGKRKFLFHRFIEFSLDMAHVLDPIATDPFNERKDLYYKNERGFALGEDFSSALVALDLVSQKDALLREIYGFCFEEMPSILGVPERQLHFKPDDTETLEELWEKKIFHQRPFTELPGIETGIDKILRRYMR